jgi:hypothetical protein
VAALAAQARLLWRDAAVVPEPAALRATAAELVLLADASLPPELEPRFF